MLELGIPVVVALNMSDEARVLGMDIDAGKLSEALGVPVIPTSAQKGSGLEELMHAFRDPRGENRLTRYDRHIESFMKQLMDADKSLSRHDAVILLSNAGDLSIYSEPVRKAAETMRKEIESTHEEPITEILASNRYGDAGLIAKSVMHHKHSSELTLKERIDNVLVNPVYGFIILALIMLCMLLVVFLIGGFLGDIIDNAFEIYILSPATTALSAHPFIQVVVRYTLIGVQAGLGIVVPYIMTFYVFMSILENTGYLTRAAFMLDEVMHRFRLHGRAMIPLILGFGCSVPAIMSTKMLQTKRERIITCAMICMVPCSARSIIIMGLVAKFVSIWAALSIYLLMLALIVAIGYILGRTVKGEETGFVLEMVPLRVPNVRDVVTKTWTQMDDFVKVAFPLLIVGSAVLGVLQYRGIPSDHERGAVADHHHVDGAAGLYGDCAGLRDPQKRNGARDAGRDGGRVRYAVRRSVHRPADVHVRGVHHHIHALPGHHRHAEARPGLEGHHTDHGADVLARAPPQRADRPPGAGRGLAALMTN